VVSTINQVWFLHCRSVDCFRLGWPMRADADFFCLPVAVPNTEKDGVHYNYTSSLFLSIYFFWVSGICYTALVSRWCGFFYTRNSNLLLLNFFYHISQDNSKPIVARDRWVGKVNFVEIRSFWHVFRSFDRMWSFYILCLQVLLSSICLCLSLELMY